MQLQPPCLYIVGNLQNKVLIYSVHISVQKECLVHIRISAHLHKHCYGITINASVDCSLDMHYLKSSNLTNILCR